MTRIFTRTPAFHYIIIEHGCRKGKVGGKEGLTYILILTTTACVEFNCTGAQWCDSWHGLWANSVYLLGFGYRAIRGTIKLPDL